MGQHDTMYTANTDELQIDAPVAPKTAKTGYIPHVANYQVIGGNHHLGKIFPLKVPMTMIGEPGKGIVVITKRKQGYFASILENTDNITLNQQPLNDQTLQLQHRDILTIGQLAVQFYLQ